MAGCIESPAAYTNRWPRAREQRMRPVRIVSIGVKPGTPEEMALEILESEARGGADMIVLPEVWTSQALGEPRPQQTPVVERVCALAHTWRTNIVYPLDRQDGPARRNTALFIDRRGEITGRYDKAYPYWDELRLPRRVDPGDEVTVVDSDVGRVGLAICFDVNFPNVWERLSDREAELVVWISAYSAGSSLRAHALNHNYYIVTATQEPDCSVFDITGEEILHEAGPQTNVSRVTIDLDRCVFHENFNLDGRDRLLAEHPGDVEMEKWLRREQWFVLRARTEGASVKDLAARYGMEPLSRYKRRSRQEIDALRGKGLRTD
jgi:predicted amidohydrolase